MEESDSYFYHLSSSQKTQEQRVDLQIQQTRGQRGQGESCLCKPRSPAPTRGHRAGCLTLLHPRPSPEDKQGPRGRRTGAQAVACGSPVCIVSTSDHGKPGSYWSRWSPHPVAQKLFQEAGHKGESNSLHPPKQNSVLCHHLLGAASDPESY